MAYVGGREGGIVLDQQDRMIVGERLGHIDQNCSGFEHSVLGLVLRR